MFTSIRKYKAFFVLFLAMNFLIYAKQYSNYTHLSDSESQNNFMFSDAITFISSNCSVNQAERLSNLFYQLKKVSFERNSLEKMTYVQQYLTFIISHKINVSSVTNSVLDINCILRI